MDLGWLIDPLRKEVALIKAFPWSFSTAVILVSALLSYIVKAIYQARLGAAEELLTFYKNKSSIAQFTPDQVKSLKSAWERAEKEIVRGKVFNSEEVPLDGHAYEDCTFNNVTFVFNGDAPFDLVHNSINGAVLKTGNPAISGFVRLLKELGWIKPGIK
jgi:hypothetical protein